MGKGTRRNLSRRQMESHTVESCGALVYCSGTKRFLFLLRPSDRRHSKSWGLVGGKIEAGETIQQGLVREILEETQFDASGHKLVPLEKFTSTDEKFIYHTFMLTIDCEFCPVLNDEHTGYCWTPLDDYPKPLHPGVWRSFSFQVVIDKIKTIQTLRDQPVLPSSSNQSV
jgi:8-oxo-dGTP pyrophosphatase MutT (NUDIX family)